MAGPISAVEHKPIDFMREVSPEALAFYVDDLSPIYLPESFLQKHGSSAEVALWNPMDRLRGKFGRFTLTLFHEDDTKESLDEVLVMGTTIAMGSFDKTYGMQSLRHYELSHAAWDVLRERGLAKKDISVKAVDYGATAIQLGASGNVEAVKVSGSSIDFGRAQTEGRQQTCDMFAKLLGGEIQIVNRDPAPRTYDDIIK